MMTSRSDPNARFPGTRAILPDHVVVEWPGADHCIQEDAPEPITAAIGDRFALRFAPTAAHMVQAEEGAAGREQRTG
nr:hypothetical protein JVH1_8791 [Rhodococcus sp. JVH1]